MKLNKKTITESEKIISRINTNVFFKEFTFSKNDFVDFNSKQEFEFADSVVWIDDIFFIFQVKGREASESNSDYKWFKNKVLNKAVKQIKDSHAFLENYSNIPVTNEKGHKRNISEAKSEKIKSIIIYSPSENFEERQRFIKCYESKQVGLIHLFHIEDYQWICTYLVTPAEIEEYLIFREELFSIHKSYINNLPEQYVLGHFLETLDTSEINLRFLDNLKIEYDEVTKFDISFILENFDNHISMIKEKTDYYPIITEIAKLNRSELIEFKKRLSKAIKLCNEKEYIIPFRVYIPRTDCGFVFIPLGDEKPELFLKRLDTFTLIHKYDQRAYRCVGFAVREIEVDGKANFDMYWEFIEFEWNYDAIVSKALSKNFPLRKAKLKKLDNRYLE